MREKFLLLIDGGVAVVKQMSEILDLRFERGGPLLVPGRLLFERIQLFLQSLSPGFRDFQLLAKSDRS